MSTSTTEQELVSFETTYEYDAGYLIQLNRDSPAAFAAFSEAMPLSRFRQELPLDAHFVARIATMQAEDCGPCAQLNLRMAVEAGVDRALLGQLIDSPDELPGALQDVRAHALAVVAGDPPDSTVCDRIRDLWGAGAFAELAIVIAGCQLYPTVKRALLKAGVCQKLSLEFATD